MRSMAVALVLLAAGTAHAWPHPGTEVGPGLIYRHLSGPIEIPGSGTSDQEIYVLYVDTENPRLTFVTSSEADKGIVVSEFAERHELAGAINANFFSGSYDSCGLMAADGVPWSSVYGSGGSCADSIGLTPERMVSFFRSDDRLMGPLPEGVTEVVTGMPMVLQGGAIVDQAVIEAPPNPSHMAVANPRTAVCLHSDGRTLAFVVVDGRASGRVGMRGITLGRFLFHNLGCSEGLNLDGGGSSTLFVAGEPGLGSRPEGIVNQTSDGSERRVCCHLGVHVGPEPEPMDMGAPLVDAGTDGGSIPSDGGRDVGSADGGERAPGDAIDSGCGCRAGTGGSAGVWLLLALVAIRRRSIALSSERPRGRAAGSTRAASGRPRSRRRRAGRSRS